MKKSVRRDLQQKPKVKVKVYKMVVRPAMLYDSEVVALIKRQETELEVVALKMQRFSLGAMRVGRLRKKYIRGTGQRVLRPSKSGQIRKIWVCAEEKLRAYLEKDAEDGAARQGGKGRTKNEGLWMYYKG